MDPKRDSRNQTSKNSSDRKSTMPKIVSWILGSVDANIGISKRGLRTTIGNVVILREGIPAIQPCKNISKRT